MVDAGPSIELIVSRPSYTREIGLISRRDEGRTGGWSADTRRSVARALKRPDRPILDSPDADIAIVSRFGLPLRDGAATAARCDTAAGEAVAPADDPIGPSLLARLLLLIHGSRLFRQKGQEKNRHGNQKSTHNSPFPLRRSSAGARS